MTWLLLRLPSGALDVDVVRDPGARVLSTHPTKPEAVALRTRARLLEEACVADEPREMVAFHALLLVGMLRARGMA